MVIELTGVQFGLILKIEQARRGSLRQSNISDQNCTTQSSITTVIHLFCNRETLLLIVF